MVRLLLLLSLAAPQGQSEAALAVDRTAIQVGDSVTLTVTVRTPEVGPVDIDESSIVGFEIVERRDRSQVSVGTGMRTTARDIVLRAEEAGEFTLGPVPVRIAGTALLTNVVRLSVAPAAQVEWDLSARVQDLIDRASPVGSDTAAAVEVAVLRLADSVRLGEQIDLVIAAWFPREIRARLRAPPVLLSPDVRGAWGYTQPAPTGVVASREVNGRTYDLFVQHEIVFALTQGDLEVGPAKVTYSLPITGSFLSREVRHEVQSVPFLVEIAPVVSAPVDRLVVGRDVSVSVAVSQTLLPAGDAARLSVTVRGTGNVALWPEPDLRWPVGVQAYQERSLVTLTLDEGMLGGTKAFEYLVVADSAGVHRLSAPTYEYYDLDRGMLVTAVAEPVVFETPETARRAEPLRRAPPLMHASWFGTLLRWMRALPTWVWLVVFAVPPVATGLVALNRRGRRRAAPQSGRERTPTGALGNLEEQVRATLAHLVPGADSGNPDRLAAALVAAGVEPSLASHAARVRERLRHARYGPEPHSDAGELAEEVGAVLRGLRGQGRGTGAAPVVAAVLAVLCLTTNSGAAQSVDRLWETGALRAVADSLSIRVRDGDGTAADWYNLSVAWEQLGEGARARAAWLEAARAFPHDQRIRRAGTRWAGQVEGAPWVAPLAPVELMVMSALLWIVGWALVSRRSRRTLGRGTLVLAVACLIGAAVITMRYRTAHAYVVADGTPIREAPYGLAPSRGILESAHAVVVRRTEGEWRLVDTGRTAGWLHSSEILEP